MNRKLALCFVAFGLAVASAKTYTMSLFQTAMVGSTELKPGEYKVEVLDQKAVIRGSNVSAEAPVKVETADTKFGRTSLRFNSSNGKMQIQEIRLGGTNMKLVLSEPAAN